VEGRIVEGRYVEGRFVGRTFFGEGRFVEGRFVVVPYRGLGRAFVVHKNRDLGGNPVN
jgi:hypothetical protein